MSEPLGPKEEAHALMALHGDARGSHGAITHQFDVIQTRTQSVIGLATLALTITGFSGPRIAANSALSRYTMILGLVWVLLAIIIALLGALRIRWLTQISAPTQEAYLVAMIAYRDQKTRRFQQSLSCLAVGLFFYVLSVVAYMATGLQ
jgi:hypothetical protein